MEGLEGRKAGIFGLRGSRTIESDAVLEAAERGQATTNRTGSWSLRTRPRLRL